MEEKNSSRPIAKKQQHTYSIHGKTIMDDYFWLRDKDNPDVIAYLEAENNYTKKMLEHTSSFQTTLFEEMKARIKEDDISAPENTDSYRYYSRNWKGKQYKSYHRKSLKTQEAHEEVLLDENELVKGYDFIKLGVFKLSPNERYLAYSVDLDGSEEFTLHVKDLETGKLLSDQIRNTSYYLEWFDDSTFFYATLSHIKQPDKVYKHKIGNDPQKDDLVYHETDERFYLSLRKSHDRNFLFIDLSSHGNSTEVYFLRLDSTDQVFRLIQIRKPKLEYYPEHWNGKFLLRTNKGEARNFKIVETPVGHPSIENWKELVPHRPAVMIQSFDVFVNHLVLFERQNGLRTIHILNRETEADHYITFPEAVYTALPPELLVDPKYDTNILRFQYTSMITPTSVYDYDMDSKDLTLIKETEIPSGYSKEEYTTKRVAAAASDGTKIFISLVYRKGLVRNGKNNLLLYGYGSYGYSIDPQFNSSRLSLLNRGMVYAIAHIRGGGEMGRPWYDDGKLFKKMNTFTDFIACAEYLIEERYTSPNHLVAMGGSAGGLLMGAVVNVRPDLFKAVVAHVPFVDVINTMLDATIPLTVMEYEEWGNPNEKEFFDYMMAYSPYDNIEKKDYPNILITGGLNDPRVQFWEPAKWAAKLREMKTDENLLLLKTEMGAGHAGKSGRYDYLKDIAEYFAFIFDRLGIKD
ncbi:MAG: S9 family peptidase [Candidatus Thorarchaeota archaeon]